MDDVLYFIAQAIINITVFILAVILTLILAGFILSVVFIALHFIQ